MLAQSLNPPAIAPSAERAQERPIVGHLRFAVTTILRAYASVVFARSPWIGLALLLATFVVPEVGAVGLIGVVLASGLSLALQLDREAVRSGLLGYNALLVFLAIGATLDRSPAFWGLAAAAALMVVLIHTGLAGALGYHFRLPVLSLPFVAATWMVQGAATHIRGMGVAGHPPALDLPNFMGPEILDTFLRSLGAIFFQPHWAAGLLVFGALVAFSRIAALHAVVGFAVAMVCDHYLFTFPADFLHLYVGFNFIMTAVAVGGIYYVPSLSSLALAVGASLMCGLVSVGLMIWVEPVGLGVLALPFNATVLMILYALGQRRGEVSPRGVDAPGSSPEESLHRYQTRVRRFETGLPVPLRLPFEGSWVCTQGNDGPLTHQGAWRHGLDFEAADASGRRFRSDGGRREDWLCWRLPVVAPGAATVVRVIDGIADNEIGEINTEENWGNLVVLQLAAELYCVLAHLGCGTVRVREGDVVAPGQVLGLCGSSGRSPIPHLHVQLQASAVVGAPTVPIRFTEVVVEGEADPRVVTGYLPEAGDRLRNVARAPELLGALQLPPGERFTLSVTAGEDRREEPVVSEVDLLGNRSLYSPGRQARLYFDDRGQTFTIYDYDGPEDSGLYALYCALSKVPMDQAPSLSWDDDLDPRRLRSSALEWALDAIRPYLPARAQAMRYRGERRGGRLWIRGQAEAVGRFQRPVQTQAILRLGRGLEQVRAQVGDRVVEATWPAS